MTKTASPVSPVRESEALAALDRCVEQVRRNLEQFTYHFPSAVSENNFYHPSENDDWTTGFWTGQIWLAYERSQERTFQYAALIQVESFLHRIREQIAVDHHDMGFLYSLSCVAAWRLTGDDHARTAAILAAGKLISRFQAQGQFIQAWGAMGEPGNYRYIIDCLMNLPLLYWASETTGDPRYADIARRHITTSLQYSIRPDNSTHHTFFFDPATGLPSHGETCQGYKNDSAWTRGQAWAIYGTALSYRYTRNPDYLDTFRRVTAYYLSRLPSDLVPFWDLTFTADDSDQPRDSSSAAIAACGLLEMAHYLPEEEAAVYTGTAQRFVKSLIDHYAVRDPQESNGLILHGTYGNKSPYNTCNHAGVDECNSWGDYFYMEALTRLTTAWRQYW